MTTQETDERSQCMPHDTLDAKLHCEASFPSSSDLVWDLLWDGPTSFSHCALVSRPLLDSCQEGLQVRIAIKAYPALGQLHNIAQDDVCCAKILDKPVKEATTSICFGSSTRLSMLL